MAENTTALVISVAALIIIIGLAVIVIRQKRRETKKQREPGQPTPQDFSPPILTVTLTASNFSERFDIDTQCSRNGLEKTPSERSDVVDVWELRQEQRRQYIIDNIMCKVRTIILCIL